MVRCPLLAQSGHEGLRRTCPLSGVMRTSTSAVEVSPLHVGTGRIKPAPALFRPCPHKSRQHNARNDGARDHQNRRKINVHRLSLLPMDKVYLYSSHRIAGGGGTGMKHPHRRQFLYLTAGVAALPAASCIARAQAYPARPIRLVIPFPPGGAYDAVGRPWADRVKSVLGTVVVENIGGGG